MQTYAFNTATLVGLLVSFVLPLLVGLVTKASTSSAVKAVLLLLLTAVTNLLSQFLATDNGPGFPWGTAILGTVIGFAMAVAAHFGLWKPTGATASAQATLNK